jgi:putative flippase GtrA
MKVKLRIWVASLLHIASSSASATNYDGVATILIGFPAFILFIVLFAIFTAMRPRRSLKVIATVIAIPILVLGVFLSHDAMSFSKRSADEWVTSALYFSLFALSMFIYYKLLTYPIASADSR